MNAMRQQAIEFHYHYCPRCGSANPSVGSVPFVCAACNLSVFFTPVAAVGGLLVNQEGLLLLVRRARDPGKGKWELPGGFVDRGESIEQALVREIAEETQLELSHIEYLTSHPNDYYYHGVMTPVADCFYICHVAAGQTLSTDAEEIEHYEWTRPTAEHLENLAFPSNRVAIEMWLERQA